ncbi:MAG: hypothetical protein KME10_04250 [Plectolyngbya sp. WJT66-NPBG17]|nr:hypothetical protein [Plectolyngbya sp. WJT66-NPBG17]
MISLLHWFRQFWTAKDPTQLAAEADQSWTLSLEDIYRKIDRKRQGFLGEQRTRLLEWKWQRMAQLINSSRNIDLNKKGDRLKRSPFET